MFGRSPELWRSHVQLLLVRDISVVKKRCHNPNPYQAELSVSAQDYCLLLPLWSSGYADIRYGSAPLTVFSAISSLLMPNSCQKGFISLHLVALRCRLAKNENPLVTCVKSGL